MLLLFNEKLLLPDNTSKELAKFMYDCFDWPSGWTTRSIHRYMFISHIRDDLRYNEGYMHLHDGTGELTVQANTIAYPRQMYLYAWDAIIAIIPCNKQVQRHWLHPDIEKITNDNGFKHPYYQNIYNERIKLCLKQT